MTKFVEKFKIYNWPFIFLAFFFFFVLFSHSVVNKYIYIVCLLGFIYFVAFKIKVSKFVVWLFCLSLISKLIVILFFKPPIESDFLTLYRASKLLANGNLEYTNWEYFITWGYQVGHVFYQALLLKMFDSVFFLKFMNILFLSGTNVLIYLIINELTGNEKISRFSSLCYLCYLHPILLCTILTNQHVPTFLFYLALYILIAKRFDKIKYKNRYLLVGCLIGIANIMRPEGIIFILSIVVYLIFICYKLNKKVIIKKVLILIFSYFLISKGCSLAFQISGISKSGLENKDPLWKFVLGTNYDSGGWYTDSDTKYLGNTSDEMNVIMERSIKNPKQFLLLLNKKARVFWLGNNLYWSNSYLYSTNLQIFSYEFNGTRVNSFLNIINNDLYFCVFLLSIIGLFSMFREKIDNRANVFIIMLCGYFVVYLFIEIMIRYTYTPRVGVFIISAYGVSYLMSFFKNKRDCKN